MFESSERAKFFNLLQAINEKLGAIAKAIGQVADEPPPGKQRIKVDVDKSLYQNMLELHGEVTAQASRNMMIEKFLVEFDAAIGYKSHPILPKKNCQCSNDSKGDKDASTSEAKPRK